jgi:hypothetical protein
VYRERYPSPSLYSSCTEGHVLIDDDLQAGAAAKTNLLVPFRAGQNLLLASFVSVLEYVMTPVREIHLGSLASRQIKQSAMSDGDESSRKYCRDHQKQLYYIIQFFMHFNSVLLNDL